MITYLKDNLNSWILSPDGTYEKKISKSNPFSAFQYFIKNPSLSGRGSRLKSNENKK
jgi:polyphosphate kinase